MNLTKSTYDAQSAGRRPAEQLICGLPAIGLRRFHVKI